MTAPVTSGLTAREVPEARQDIIDWAARTRGQGADRTRPGFADMVATNARHAELYYVNRDMTALARTIGAGLDVYGLSREDLPSEYGFLVWDAPAASNEPPQAASVAVLWLTFGGRVALTLMGAADAYRTWAASFGTQAVRDAQLITAGKLTLRGQATNLTVDQPDQPWESLDLGDFEETARTLLATWILMRQPAEERRTLHQVEEVLPAKASAKRIARAGGDPTRPVRLITLRQSLRRDDAATTAESHAERVYRHRWIVRPHRVRQHYPSTGEHRTIWRGPYLVVPRGCEDAPILGGERVNVLRR
jgi:hypothetical protein